MHKTGLPCNEAAIKAHPQLKQDNIATILLARYQVTCSMWDGLAAAGPQPILFSTDPAKVATDMAASPEAAHRMVQALAGRLLRTEQITCQEAILYIESPRDGKGTTPLLRTWTARSPPKKARIMDGPAETSSATASAIGDAPGIYHMFTKSYNAV
jgi:hypothetical protein